MIAIRLDVLLQLRRHWRAIDILLVNEIEYQKEQEVEREKAQAAKLSPHQPEQVEINKHRQWSR